MQHALIRAHPLGFLISATPQGLVANPIPFVLDEGAAGTLGTLRCHVARANTHWRSLQADAECLVVFQGPQHYVSPTWYVTKQETGKVVPTWNYAMVQCWGRAQIRDDAVWLRQQIDELTSVHEYDRPQPWAASDAPPPCIDAQLRGIVGIEIPIARIEGKWKVSQNRSLVDQQGVIAGLATETDLQAEPMARLVADRLHE